MMTIDGDAVDGNIFQRFDRMWPGSRDETPRGVAACRALSRSTATRLFGARQARPAVDRNVATAKFFNIVLRSTHRMIAATP